VHIVQRRGDGDLVAVSGVGYEDLVGWPGDGVGSEQAGWRKRLG
jgi:hypothetical protein